MNTVIICGFVFLIVGVVIRVICDFDGSFLVTLCAAGAMLGLFIAGICGCFVPTEIKTETEYIYSLNDFSTREGSFVLGAGYIGDELEYHYFVENENGELEYNSISAKSVDIKFDDIPRIEKYKNVSKFDSWVIVPSCSQKDILFVPKEFVIDNISIDLE